MENTLLGRHHLFKIGHLAELLMLPQQRKEETEARSICMDMLERFGLADDAHKRPATSRSAPRRSSRSAGLWCLTPRWCCSTSRRPASAPTTSPCFCGCCENSFAAQDVCLVIIEHDLELVTALCPEISVLHFGRIISQGRRPTSRRTQP